MDLLEAIVMSSFDILCIVSEISVDGVGYVAWLVYALVMSLKLIFANLFR